jgi:hypothetical protein
MRCLFDFEVRFADENKGYAKEQRQQSDTYPSRLDVSM